MPLFVLKYSQSGDVSEIFSSHHDPQSKGEASKNVESEELDLKATLWEVKSLGKRVDLCSSDLPYLIVDSLPPTFSVCLTPSTPLLAHTQYVPSVSIVISFWKRQTKP